MKHFGVIVGCFLVTFLTLARAELGLLSTRLEGMREKCFIEELPKNTVILVKYKSEMLDMTTGAPITHIPLNMLVTVRDPQGQNVIRQTTSPVNKLFMTASVDGEYNICFQSMPNQYVQNGGARLALEFFIGDDHDPRITAPVQVQLHDLSTEVATNNHLIADIKLQQKLQREREEDFRRVNDSLLSATFWYAALQSAVLVATVAVQINHLQKFFAYKKIV